MLWPTRSMYSLWVTTFEEGREFPVVLSSTQEKNILMLSSKYGNIFSYSFFLSKKCFNAGVWVEWIILFLEIFNTTCTLLLNSLFKMVLIECLCSCARPENTSASQMCYGYKQFCMKHIGFCCGVAFVCFCFCLVLKMWKGLWYSFERLSD